MQKSQRTSQHGTQNVNTRNRTTQKLKTKSYTVWYIICELPKLYHLCKQKWITTKRNWIWWYVELAVKSVRLYLTSVKSVWYFRIVPTLWYFRIVPTLWYLRTVLTLWYFRIVPTLWYLELFWHCGILELFRHCGILEFLRHCGILEFFRHCGILEFFWHCGIFVLLFFIWYWTSNRNKIMNKIKKKEYHTVGTNPK
jgi:hypothetical protein